MPTRKIPDTAYAPRMMRAIRAADYLGMSRRSFLRLVEEGEIPNPKIVKGMKLWDRLALDHWAEFLSENKPRKRNSFDRKYGADSDDDGA
jgi:excisionase family DNA binding protein